MKYFVRIVAMSSIIYLLKSYSQSNIYIYNILYRYICFCSQTDNNTIATQYILTFINYRHISH